MIKIGSVVLEPIADITLCERGYIHTLMQIYIYNIQESIISLEFPIEEINKS